MPDPAASATPDNAAGATEPAAGVVREFPRPTPESPYLNRELSWLDFNHRVLALADVADTPVLERAKFLAIFSSNLDEFFQVRVAILKEQEAARLGGSSPDGLTPSEQLRAIRARIADLIDDQSKIFSGRVVPALGEAGVVLCAWDAIGDDDRGFLDDGAEYAVELGTAAPGLAGEAVGILGLVERVQNDFA